jgi:hypothetical protein
VTVPVASVLGAKPLYRRLSPDEGQRLAEVSLVPARKALERLGVS